MKNYAVICEYNPFHNGHKYQLDRMRADGADGIFCIMSGAFVQSAMPAFCGKAVRAECAVLSGADAVIELPTVYATASAQIFAEGALKIISGIKDISRLAMGCVGDPSAVLRVADIKLRYAQEFRDTLKRELKTGKSYNAAATNALTSIYTKLYPDRSDMAALLSDPNNILCVEYISAIDKYCPSIQPCLIQRVGTKHNDDEACGGYISATAIRERKIDDVREYIPFNFDKIKSERKDHAPDIDAYKKMAAFALKRADPSEISVLRDCSEGMEFLLKKFDHAQFDDYVDCAVGRRYGKKRIYRLFLDALLGIDKSLTDKKFCTRLLACKNDFDFTQLPHCVKTVNADIKAAAQCSTEVKSVLDIDIKATALYNTLCGIGGDYYKYSMVKI